MEEGADYGRPQARHAPEYDPNDLELKVVRKRCRGKGPASRLTTGGVEKKRKHVDEEPHTVKKRKTEPWPKEHCQGRDKTVIAATTRYEQGFSNVYRCSLDGRRIRMCSASRRL
eukprot:5510265-Amphidinium_carterae.1